MKMLIKWRDGAARAAEDPFTFVGDDQGVPPGDIIISLQRFMTEGRQLLAQCRTLGVRLSASDAPEDLAGELDRLAVIELEFPKFRDGRQYSAARIMRERMGFKGELRAVGDVLREQAYQMVRCGFDAFEPADGSTAADWTASALRFRHVYQRAADRREPAFAQRTDRREPAFAERGGF
ncbi:MAG: DUF934 domain-containing protein [Caulobacteraceae bacterium]|nr:DUF934 domain-containing protein [Caulobacteraceae bacterium]